MLSLSFLCLSFFALSVTAAYDNSRYDNVAVYWGQNSHGASNSDDTANSQKPISFYCQDDAIDVFPIAFVNKFKSTGGLPELNLANICNNKDNKTFPGSALPDCSAIAPDLKACQAKGKLLTLSLGGAGGGVSFQSDSDAEAFADLIWNSFFAGNSSTRPFGDVVLDGVDLDIESGDSTGYAAFVNKMRSSASSASKEIIVTAAPQCVFPDASLGGVLNAASFDAVYVQFYNNQCGLQNFKVTGDFNFGTWDYWARNTSPNKNIKVYVGAPASTGAGGGYVDIGTLSSIATQMRKSFPSFGGVMLWDASQAYANNRFDKGIKDALVQAGGTGFTFPPCSAAAYSSGATYTGGSQVSYKGYIWVNKFWSQSAPSQDPNSDWVPVSACQGGNSSTSLLGRRLPTIAKDA